jgi:hypothetical protein
MKQVVILAAIAIAFFGANPIARAQHLSPETAKAFDQYAAAREERFLREVSDRAKFLEADPANESDASKTHLQLQQGQILIRNELAGKNSSVPGGLLHDWVATIFIPGATLRSTLQILQDYAQDQVIYRPDVVQSKLISRNGDDFKVFLRLKRTYVITAVFDTEYDVHYTQLDSHRAYSRSISTRIAEVENAGTPDEHIDPVGDDRGLLWRLNSYWRFYEADGGTYVQCQAVSLSRDIPTGLGWMIRPFVEKVPMESLRFTLSATRDAVAKSTR